MSCCRYLVTPGRLSIFKRVWILALLSISILHISHYGKRNIIIRQNEMQKSGLKNNTFVKGHINTKLNGTKFVTRENSSNLSNPIVEPLKVLLIASNPRSGSSFVGELISSMPNVSYFFEPLWLVDKRVQIIKEPMSQLEYLQLKMRMETRWRMGEIRKKSLEKLLNESRHQSKSDSEIITEVWKRFVKLTFLLNLFIENVFTENQLDKSTFELQVSWFQKHSWGRKSKGLCVQEALPEGQWVWKITIWGEKFILSIHEWRLHYIPVKSHQIVQTQNGRHYKRNEVIFLEPKNAQFCNFCFLTRNASSPLGSKFKVILLLRDPRATINSINQQPQEWISGTSNPSTICRNGVSDYMAVREVIKFRNLLLNFYIPTYKVHTFLFRIQIFQIELWYWNMKN